MAKKEDIFYDSRDGKTKIHGVIWKPDCMLTEPAEKPRCVLQIIHGMEEHIERYDEFARFLNAHDICVIGNDHLGHGRSVSPDIPHGYFGKGDCATVVVRDVHRLKKTVQEQIPDVPFLILGHSMGSFIARNYITRYGSGIAGAVIMGTGSQPGALLVVGKALTSFMSLFFGRKHKSGLVHAMAFGSYLKRIPNPESSGDWLSRNRENVIRFGEDPLCGFGFTLGGYHTLFQLIARAQSASMIERIPKDLPLFFVAGDEDPVGQYGKGVEKALARYRKAGMTNLKLKFYVGDRHEILNEDDREQVSQDIYDWIETII